MDRLIECLAAILHERVWVSWVQFHLGCAIENEDGSITIPGRRVKALRIRSRMDYHHLSESDKNYYRYQVAKLLRAIKRCKIEQELGYGQLEAQRAADLFRGVDECGAPCARGSVSSVRQGDLVGAPQTP